MSLSFELDPPVTPQLRENLVDLWADVTDADGAVGFVPPADRAAIRAEQLRHLTAMAEGRTRLLVGREADGTVAATAYLTLNTHRLMTHWCWLYTVMVHPRHQGKGYGRDLMAAAAEAARGLPGLTGIRLTCRGGRGVENFYAACGYKEVGRVPGAIRTGEDTYEDDITLWLELGPTG
ncbi:GNAT family N-acetyltransferase [Streptomyces sp. NPDC059740]|uniref:GNAT family N-acetyltransferase n=1 Tax=Streptomyces sp. NPDC059740 TaxID=3346926 RepID=UPI0036670E41